MDKSYILQIHNLSKKFGDTLALDNINLGLEKGKVYGLIGRNGAGKTTLLKLISNMIFPTSGQIVKNTDYLGPAGDIAFGRNYDIKYFTHKIEDVFTMAAYAFPNWHQAYMEDLVQAFELDTKKRYHTCSAGTQTMVGLVLALAANPKLLLLDEPYVGLDPINREHFYNFLRKHYFDGEKTVLISSHMIKEIEGYFEKTIIIHKGQVLLNEDLETLKTKTFIIHTNQADWLETSLNVIGKEVLGKRATYYVYDQVNSQVQNKIQADGGQIESMDLQTFMVKMLTQGGGK